MTDGLELARPNGAARFLGLGFNVSKELNSLGLGLTDDHFELTLQLRLLANGHRNGRHLQSSKVRTANTIQLSELFPSSVWSLIKAGLQKIVPNELEDREREAQERRAHGSPN